MDESVFSNNPSAVSTNEESDPWTVLIVDDDGDVHFITRLVLKDFEFEGRPLRIASAYSGEETLEWMRLNNGAAIMLLDVVMESHAAGLELVDVIRNELSDHRVRIVLRSGQAGFKEVSDVIHQYDINNYLRKESTGQQDLKDAVLLALRSYRDIQIESFTRLSS